MISCLFAFNESHNCGLYKVIKIIVERGNLRVKFMRMRLLSLIIAILFLLSLLTTMANALNEYSEFKGNEFTNKYMKVRIKDYYTEILSPDGKYLKAILKWIVQVYDQKTGEWKTLEWRSKPKIIIKNNNEEHMVIRNGLLEDKFNFSILYIAPKKGSLKQPLHTVLVIKSLKQKQTIRLIWVIDKININKIRYIKPRLIHHQLKEIDLKGLTPDKECLELKKPMATLLFSNAKHRMEFALSFIDLLSYLRKCSISIVKENNNLRPKIQIVFSKFTLIMNETLNIHLHIGEVTRTNTKFTTHNMSTGAIPIETTYTSELPTYPVNDYRKIYDNDGNHVATLTVSIIGDPGEGEKASTTDEFTLRIGYGVSNPSNSWFLNYLSITVKWLENSVGDTPSTAPNYVSLEIKYDSYQEDDVTSDFLEGIGKWILNMLKALCPYGWIIPDPFYFAEKSTNVGLSMDKITRVYDAGSYIDPFTGAVVYYSLGTQGIGWWMFIDLTKAADRPTTCVFVFCASAKAYIVHEIVYGLWYDVYSVILNTPWDIEINFD